MTLPAIPAPRRRLRRWQPGFTLLELLGVLLVLAVLAAIAVPTFDRVRSNTVEAVAQSTLEILERNGEAIAVTDPDLSDTAIAETAMNELEAPDGVVVTRSGTTLTVTVTRGGLSATGVLSFTDGNGSITDAIIDASPTSTTTSTPMALSVSYAQTTFDLDAASQTLTPTVNGGAADSFALTGTLPQGVAFDPATGKLTGPLAWNRPAGAIRTNTEHTCAIVNGGAKCWGGSNEYGQLGNGTTNSSNFPVAVTGLTTGVTDIATGRFHSCAVTTAGAVKCWGRNYNYELGDGTWTQRSTPVTPVGMSSGAVKVVAGEKHTCVLTVDGAVKCWGGNLQGQLGDGTDIDRPIHVDVVGLSSGVLDVSAGANHTCAVTTGGGVKCWGGGGFGQLGNGDTSRRISPVDVSGLSSGVADVDAGEMHTCAVTTGGGVKCWGGNTFGELGDGTTTDRSTPVDVSGLSGGVVEVAVAPYHTCARTTLGGLTCWGWNAAGQLGDGSTSSRSTPVDALGLRPDVTDVSTSYGTTCVVTSSGAAQCWGSNALGKIGDGTRTGRTAPVDVYGLSGNPGFPAGLTIEVVTSTGSASTTVTLTLG